MMALKDNKFAVVSSGFIATDDIVYLDTIQSSHLLLDGAFSSYVNPTLNMAPEYYPEMRPTMVACLYDYTEAEGITNERCMV